MFTFWYVLNSFSFKKLGLLKSFICIVVEWTKKARVIVENDGVLKRLKLLCSTNDNVQEQVLQGDNFMKWDLSWYF